MADIVDFLSGQVACELFAGLSQAPLTSPLRLTDFVPATFPGYTSTTFVTESQTPFVPGWGIISGGASFTFLGDEPGVIVTSMWIIARFERVYYLVRVVPLVGTAANLLRPGRTNIYATIAAHRIPAR